MQLQLTGETHDEARPHPRAPGRAEVHVRHPAEVRVADDLCHGGAEQQPAFLESRLAYRIQELTYGGPDRETRRMLDLLADEVGGTLTRKSQIADPRNPVVGTRLIREWNGVEHTITVLRDGFEWQGRPYKSLSAIARAITGTRWNGYRFFGLRERKRGND
jgi:hypothetical protein